MKMNDKPLVSVVVPTHNDSKYIKEAMSSIVNQTYKNLDIVVVDDFSTDETVSIVNSFNDPRIRIFRNDSNRGAAYSRNRAIKECKGEYISFLDGDDIWDLTKTEKQIDYMLANGYVFCSCFYSFIASDGTQIGKYMSAPKRVTHKHFLKTDYIGCITTIYKKSIFPDLEIPNSLIKRNDYALWIKLSEKADCWSFPIVLAYHRNRDGSISSGKKSKLLKHHKFLFQELYGFGRLKASVYALRNVFYYIVRKMVYLKRIKD